MTRYPTYFPIGENYALPGPTYRLGEPGAGTRRIEIDEELDEYVAAKRSVQGLWASSALRERLEPAVTSWIQSVISEDQPALPAAGSLDAMIAAIQEDVVIMRRDEADPAFRATAAYVHVAFPSGWCPECAVGKSFLSIHHPVPNHGDFAGPGRRAGAELLFAGAESVRFVWTLTPDDALDRRRCDKNPTEGKRHPSLESSWENSDAAFLRVERQTINPLDQRTSAFFIRVYRHDLRQLDTAERKQLRSCLLDMPEAIRRYKNLDAAFRQIVDWL